MSYYDYIEEHNDPIVSFVTQMKIVRLILISVLFLFLELLLIRLIATEVRIFGYLPNVVMLIIFFAAGAGMLINKRVPLALSGTSLVLLMLGLRYRFFSPITDYVAPFYDSVIWHVKETGTIGELVLGIGLMSCLFFLLVGVFLPIGQYLGEQLQEKNVLKLYSIHIGSALAGLWMFYAISAQSISPYGGALVALFCFLILLEKQFVLSAALLFIASSALIVPGMTSDVIFWSPYQKLGITKDTYSPVMPEQYTITVNDVGFMGLLDLSKQSTEMYDQTIRVQGAVSELAIRFQDLYRIPYRFIPRPKNVLIIGAGGGNDVAAALRAGAEQVDAVEIDPVIIALGKKYHPERPYADPRVRIYIEDGRAFIRNTQKKYDVVILGYVDSHMTNATVSNIPLDNNLYTYESLLAIRQVLRPDGLLALSFGVSREWIGERLSSTISAAYGVRPMIFTVLETYSGGGTFFLVGRNTALFDQAMAREPDLAEFIKTYRSEYAETTRLLRDDWPYLYLRAPMIPKILLVISGVILISGVFFFRQKGILTRFHAASFFLGTAFLLYQFQNVTKTALLFGSTWVSTLYVVTGVLTAGLLSSLVASVLRGTRYRFDTQTILFLLLAITIALVSQVSPAVFLPLPYFWRVVVATAFLTLPLFFSGIIFAVELGESKDTKSVMASNFMGSVAGGIVSFVSFSSGIQSLLFIGAACYVCAYVFLRRRVAR